MTTKTAYLTFMYSNGSFERIRLDLSNKTSENRMKNVMAGSVTTFDILEDSNPSSLKVLPGDVLVSNTRTIYPANVAVLEVKIVESEPIEPVE